MDVFSKHMNVQLVVMAVTLMDHMAVNVKMGVPVMVSNVITSMNEQIGWMISYGVMWALHVLI